MFWSKTLIKFIDSIDLNFGSTKGREGLNLFDVNLFLRAELEERFAPQGIWLIALHSW